jgi:hypothetical protein
MEPQRRTREDPEPPASDDEPDSTTAPEGLTWAQRSLRMRTWISVMGALMCAFVTVLFLRQDAIPEAAAFGVIGLLSLGYLGWTQGVKRRRTQR